MGSMFRLANVEGFTDTTLRLRPCLCGLGAFRSLYSIAQQHGDRHRPHAARHRRDVTRFFFDRLEIYVTRKLTVRHAIDANIVLPLHRASPCWR